MLLISRLVTRHNIDTSIWFLVHVVLPVDDQNQNFEIETQVNLKNTYFKKTTIKFEMNVALAIEVVRHQNKRTQ